MKFNLVSVDDVDGWRNILRKFSYVDVCSTPEYHRLYDTRSMGSKSYLWEVSERDRCFAYSFMLTPVILSWGDKEISTGFNDISSTYGYGGPLCNTTNEEFVRNAWQAFDDWAAKKNVIAEFTRFSVFGRSHKLAHPATKVSLNRKVAVSVLPSDTEKIFALLPSKTRNMVRKAVKSGFEARELDLVKGLKDFRRLYEETMERNNAPSFFIYDDTYYQLMTEFPEGEVRLFGVFDGDKLVSAAIALTYKDNALYHLGASLLEYSSMGAGNLGLYTMTCGLQKSGVRFLNVGGGRTTEDDDQLLRFKKSNALGVDNYLIGRRILLSGEYDRLAREWMDMTARTEKPTRLIFYR